MKISIITAVYNNKDEIRLAIDSVLSQVGIDLEYIVVDGGSSDGTTQLVEQYGRRITKFVSEKDRGIFDALNKGITMATGDIVGILHSDDLFDASDILSQVVGLFERTGCDAVYGDLLYVSKQNTQKVIRYWKSCPFDARNFRKGWMPAHPSLFMKREVYSQYGLFDIRYRIASDYELMLRTLGSGKLRCEYLPKVITRMRVGGASNKSLKNIWMKSYEDYIALRRNKKGGVVTLFLKNISKLSQFVKRKQV